MCSWWIKSFFQVIDLTRLIPRKLEPPEYTRLGGDISDPYHGSGSARSSIEEAMIDLLWSDPDDY